MSIKKLLIVANTPSVNTESLAAAVLRGAQHPDIESVSASCQTPFETTVDDVLNADGLILGTTENFGYMSGALKDFFDRVYYPILEQKQGTPYALYVRAGLDGTGTITAVERIITGLRWKPVCAPVLLHGAYSETFIPRCEELGMLLAASLDTGIV